MSCGLGRSIRCPGSFRDRGPQAVEEVGSQVDDRLAAVHGPFHAGVFEALGEQRLAGGLGDAAANGSAAGVERGTVPLSRSEQKQPGIFVVPIVFQNCIRVEADHCILLLIRHLVEKRG